MIKMSEHLVVEGTPDRPGRPRYVWEIQSVNPLTEELSEDGTSLFYLVQRVVGQWFAPDDEALSRYFDPTELADLADYQVVYATRTGELPPIQRLTLSSLDDDGGIVNELRR